MGFQTNYIGSGEYFVADLSAPNDIDVTVELVKNDFPNQTVLDSTKYLGAVTPFPANQAWGRSPDGTGQFTTLAPTMGAPNPESTGAFIGPAFRAMRVFRPWSTRVSAT